MTKLKTRQTTKTGKTRATSVLALVGFLFFFFPVSLFAATEVTALVDRDTLSPNDTFTFTISVTSSEEVSVGQPEAPRFEDFEILNTWTGQEARASFVNTPNGPSFQTVRSTNYNFSLQPKKQGKLRLGSVQVEVDGRKYNTKPISITVAPGAGGAQHGRPRGGGGGGIQMPPGFDDEEDDVFSQLLRRQMPGAGGSRTLPINPQEAFFIQVDLDKTDVFVGEQVTASWYLYTRGQIRDLDTLKYPSLRGFWKEDIELATQLNFTSEVVNGIPYKKALLASFALFPIKEGVATVDPYQAKCTVVPMIDSFGGAFGMGKAYTFTKSSMPVKVTVRPLPTEGRPTDFTGAVGSFDVTTRVEDKNIVENQPFTLKVRFEGQGNAKLIEQPPFQPPEGLEIYDSQNEARFFRTGTSFKEFNILLIPRREGEFTIPGFSTSVFDPKERKYVVKTTNPIRVIVGKGVASARTQSLGLDESAPKKPQGPEEPKLITEWKVEKRVAPQQAAIGYASLFIFVILTLLWRARTELGWGQKKKDLQRQLRARIRRVDEKVAKGDWRGVGTEMTNAAYFVLGEISGEGGANVELSKLLLKAPPSVRRELGAPIEKQLEVFQVLSFAPDHLVGTLKDPAQLKKSVSEMAKLLDRAVALGAAHAEEAEGSTASV
jgi:hypothetical protein